MTRPPGKQPTPMDELAARRDEKLLQMCDTVEEVIRPIRGDPQTLVTALRYMADLKEIEIRRHSGGRIVVDPNRCWPDICTDGL